MNFHFRGFHIRDFHNRDTVIPKELLQNISFNMERAEQGSIYTEYP
jgi:hypothetical protein